MQRSIRRQLLWLGALTVVPALVVLGGTQWMTRDRALTRTIEDSRRVARLAAAEQSSFFAGTDHLLRTLAAAHVPTGSACSDALADVRAEHPRYLNLSIVEPSGTVVCSALREVVGQSLADRDWFQRALSHRKLVVGDYQIGRVTGKPDIIVAFPKLDANGAVTRVFHAAIELTQFSAAVATTTLPPGSVLTLLDRNQTVLFRHPDPERWVGKVLPTGAAAERIRAGAPDDVREDAGLDGIDRVWITVPVNTGDERIMILAYGVPNDVVFAEADNVLRQGMWLLLAVFAATVAVAVAAGERFVVRPFQALADVTRRIGAGDLAARVQLSKSVPVVRDLAGSINEMALALEDRRRDEERLRVLVHAIESTNEMVTVTDLEDRFTFVNRAFLQTYGYTAEEVLGRTPEMLRSGNAPASLIEDMRRRTRSGGWSGELSNRRKDGSEFFISLNTSVIRGRHGEVLGLLGVARDVTERRALEDRVRQANKMEAIGQLAGGIAHDFNNILTVILGSVELLLRANTGQAVPEELTDIKAAGKSAAALTQQLLAFSRRQVLQAQPFDLNEVVTGLSPLIRRVIGEDLTFTTRLQSQLDCVIADRSQLEQVVLNLVVNARDAMPDGGTLSIETANATIDEAFAATHPAAVVGNYVRLSLTDTGAGMDERTRERLFEPFFTTKGQGKGTGLGLATVYGIVKQSGGYVYVETAVGAGSTFHVYLPRTMRMPVTATSARVGEAGTETILLVEDEPAVRNIATRVLQTAGYRLLTAGRPLEALEIASRHDGPIHALLTDVVMPEMNGFDLAKAITSARRDTRVLFMSGYPKREGLPADLPSQVALIAKPFMPDDLLIQIRALLDSRVM